MNIVIFSYHFLPMAGAESYCSTRFASALASAGHHVHVVTMDWPTQVSESVCERLVDDRLSITRIPFQEASHTPIGCRVRYLTHECDVVNASACIRALKSVLKNTTHPLLISRTHPLTSLIVAWHCRRYADKWIAHLSDPIPFYGGRIKRFLMRLWCKRAFHDATGISLTCDNAIRFYRENYPHAFDERKSFVTTHVGEPWLAAETPYVKPNDLPIVAHTGLFYAGRGAGPLLASVKILNGEGCACQLIQIGEVDPSISAEFESSPNVLKIDNASPSTSAAIVEAADVLFVSDVQIHSRYIPYLPSKFAYQLFTDKPLVVFTKQDSPMGHYCERFKNAGLFFADADRPNTLTDAIRGALGAVKNHCKFDRSEIRNQFSTGKIAAEFISNCAKL